MVTRLNAGHAGSDFFDHRAALVAEDGGENSLRVIATQGVGIGVADAGGDIAHHDLTSLRRLYVDFLDDEGLACFPGNGGS